MSRRWERQSALPGVLVDRAYGIMHDWGTTVPADASAGFGPGCIFQDVDASSGSQIWVNTGSKTSSAFKAVLVSGSATSFDWSAGADTITLKAATQHALSITDGTTTILDIDTRVATDGAKGVALGGAPPTFAAATGSAYNQVAINAITVTLTGTTTVTALNGVGLNVGAATVTDASAVTVTTISNMYVALPVAAGSVTGTNIFAAHFAGAVRLDGNLNVANQATSVTLKTATQHALKVFDGTTTMFDLDTRSTTDGAIGVTLAAIAPTFAAAAGSAFNQVAISAITVTLTGVTGVTALNGVGLNIGAPTVTDASACTVTTMSNLYVALPVAAGSITGTNIYAAHFAGQVRLDGNLNISAQATTVKGIANTAAAVVINDGTTSLYAIDSRNTVTVQNHLFDMPASQTLPNGATSRYRGVSINAHTVTLAGVTQVTTVNQGAGLFIGAPTYAQSGGAVTVDQVSTLHVPAPIAGASVTITAKYTISTDVSDCYLTAAGVWTDHACFADGKKAIAQAAYGAIEGLVERLTPRTWKYRPEMHGDDMDRDRVGIVFDELPDELRAPGAKTAVSPGLLSSFALAAIRMLWDENKQLKERLTRLEMA